MSHSTKGLDFHGRPRVHTHMCGLDLRSGGPWEPNKGGVLGIKDAGTVDVHLYGDATGDDEKWVGRR